MTQKNVFDDPFDYSEMVESLFKKADKWEEMLIHAAIGVAGEAIELMAEDHDANWEGCQEELGDMAFYIQKILNLYGVTAESQPDFTKVGPMVDGYLNKDSDRFQSVMKRIEFRSGELLDNAKKMWVYEDASKKDDVIACLYALMGHIILYTMINPEVGSIEYLRQQNRKKLSKRYPQGVFTNKDAQERKDKQ